MRRFLLVFLFAAALLAVPAQAQQASVALVVAAPGEPLGTGEVGAELLSAEARALRQQRRGRHAVPATLDEEVSTEEFKRGALVGGLAGLAGGALIGAALGGERNARIETALPVGLAGLALGAPVGVYVYADRAPRYLWGVGGMIGAVAAGTAVLLIE